MDIPAINKFSFTALSAIMLIFISSCSGISPGDILKIPKQEDIETPPTLPDKKDVLANSAVYGYPAEKVWDAATDSIYWIKWKPFLKDMDQNVIVLKEAYVYENKGSIKRIYNWPPMAELAESDLYDYIDRISRTKSREIKRNSVFTQENMRIKIIEESDNRTKVSIQYEVIPHMKNGEIGNILDSSYYIESVVLNKIEENLNNLVN